MSSVIAVHPEFDGYWPFAADYFRQLWQAQGPLTFIRLAHGDHRPLGDVIAFPAEVTRLVSLNLPVTEETNTIRPRAARRRGRVACVTAAWPTTLTSSWRRSSSTEIGRAHV